MIVKEFYGTRNDGVNLCRTFSDIGNYILQNETGIEYTEAVDVEGAPYTYSETNRLIDNETEITGDEITGEEFLEMIKEVL